MDWSRRRALSAVATGIAAAVAGCAASEEASITEPPGPDETAIEDYEFERVRNEAGEVLFARGDAVRTPAERSDRPVHGYTYDHVTSAEDLDEYAFAEVPEADRLREFAAATDFESESLFLFATFVDACHDVEIESVAIGDNGHPHGRFCQATRPADVACSTDETHSVGYAIRLPMALDDASGTGAGMSSSCRRRPPGAAFEADVTPAGGEDE